MSDATRDADVLVVGGGFAGVAAAAALRARGARVIVLDARRTLGGRARSDTLGALTIDVGAQLIATSFARTRALLAPADAARAGGDDALWPTPGRDLYAHGDERLPVQLGSVRSLLGFRGLTSGEKMRLGTRFLPLLARERARLDANAALIPPILDAENAHAWMAHRVGAHAADVLVEAPLGTFYAARGRETSFAFYLVIASYGSDSDVLAPVAGWSSLLHAALRGARHEAGVRVQSLTVERDGAHDTVIARAVDDRAWRASGAIIAASAPQTLALLAPLLPRDGELAAWLGGVPSRRGLTLALLADRALPRAAFGIFAEPARARLVSACAVHGAKLAAPPADADVLLAWPTPAAAERLADQPPGDIASAMLPEIEALVPEIRGHVVRARVYRFDDGTPIAHPGFAADRAHGRALAEAIAAELPVALAGDHFTTPIIEGAVASGERAAAVLAARLRLAAEPADSSEGRSPHI